MSPSFAADPAKFSSIIREIALVNDVFESSGRRFSSYLNDELPASGVERFWICSVFEKSSFLAALSRGDVERTDIFQLEHFLRERLDFSSRVAQWICTTWATALGIEISTPSGSFACPHCSLEGASNDLWRDRVAICPCCNARLRFSTSLSFVMEKKGWPKKRLRGKRWLLTDPEYCQSGSSLRDEIARIIENDDIDSCSLARHVGLDLIVGALQDEVLVLLGETFQQATATGAIIVSAVLDSALESVRSALQSSNEEQFLATVFPELCGSENEELVAFIGSSCESLMHCLAFTDTSLYYVNGEDRWAVLYQDMYKLGVFLGDSPTTIRLGSRRSIELSGLGIPRRTMHPVLRVIGKCINVMLQNRSSRL